MSALCQTLDRDPDDVCLQVLDAVVSMDREIQVAVEAWLMGYGISRK